MLEPLFSKLKSIFSKKFKFFLIIFFFFSLQYINKNPPPPAPKILPPNAPDFFAIL